MATTINKVWALTGGIACGKSTVSEILTTNGWEVIDSDEIAHRLMQPGAENWQKIIDVFGRIVLKHDETIDRRVLGDLVFHDSQLRNKLNAVVHPAIRRVWQEERESFIQGASGRPLVVVIPLLFEKQLDQEFSQVACVGCSLVTQEDRLRKRELNLSQAHARLKSQWPVSEKLKMAQVIFWNEGTLDTLKRQVDLFASAVCHGKIKY